jgi:hypothetical protein
VDWPIPWQKTEAQARTLLEGLASRQMQSRYLEWLLGSYGFAHRA